MNNKLSRKQLESSLDAVLDTAAVLGKIRNSFSVLLNNIWKLF